MSEKMSLQGRYELVACLRERYREAQIADKTRILDEFIAVTGYSRKHSIALLNAEPDQQKVKRKRAPIYDLEVRDALIILWEAANRVCSKRLVPFLPELVDAMERHGRLILKKLIKEKVLAMSASTIDRILVNERRTYGISLTRPGPLLKKQIPIRTFADWDDVQPGFLEADLVAHCGDSAAGRFVQTLVLTDVNTGWTEPFALLHKREDYVIAGITEIRKILPFPLAGLDTDNGNEFINQLLTDYCSENKIVFTRGRPQKKNDQCRVEEKNGSIVRKTVGYNRYEGSEAQNAFNRLYAVLRLYVNFFQPSMKLSVKERTGSRVRKKYQTALTPYRRLLASDILSEEAKAALNAIYLNLDPTDLLHTVENLQEAGKLGVSPPQSSPKNRA